jgi:endonuclease/exonuclease/phosphatase family metal-dependent hydrolase
MLVGAGCDDGPLLTPLPSEDAATADRSIAEPDTSTGDLDAAPDAGVIRDAQADRATIDPCSDAGGTAQNIRVLAANITSGNNQSYDEGAGIRLFQAISADVIMIQEFNYKSSNVTDITEFVTSTFGPTFTYARGPGQIANGVISRFPILDSGSIADPQVSNRTFVWARVDIPGDKDLWAFSVHLLTAGSTQRNAEAQALTTDIKALVPKGDYVAIGGDFNTDNRAESCVTTLSAVVATQGPHPADTTGNGNTSANRSKPYDWMLVSPELDSRATPLKLKSRTFPNGLVLDTRSYTPLAELKPPLTGTESQASNMQHMPVARDFVVQCK